MDKLFQMFDRRKINLPSNSRVWLRLHLLWSFANPFNRFFSQFMLFVWRAIVQQLRNMPAVVLDMLLVASSGLFLGIIFANTTYQGRVSIYFLVLILKSGPPSAELCNRLVVAPLIQRCELPLDDPIGTIASLTCLSVALTAVASSLRVFGNEVRECISIMNLTDSMQRVVYWREASWGLDTVAYFLGKGRTFIIKLHWPL